MIDFGKLFPESWYTCIPSGSTRVCPALFAANGQWLNDYCVWWGKGSPKLFLFAFLVSPSESNLLHAFIVHLFFIFPDIYRLAFSSYYLSILSIFMLFVHWRGRCFFFNIYSNWPIHFIIYLNSEVSSSMVKIYLYQSSFH